jgi:hypothetical protein
VSKLYINVEAYRISPWASTIVSSSNTYYNQRSFRNPRRQVELTCLTTACWIVSSKNPFASVLVGVAVPDVGPSDCLLDILVSIDTAKAR